MERVDHGNGDSVSTDRTSLIHPGRILKPLRPQPIRQLNLRNDVRARGLSDRQRARNMIAVRVGKKDQVALFNSMPFGRACRIPLQPGVNEYGFSTRRFHQKGGVSQPGNGDVAINRHNQLLIEQELNYSSRQMSGRSKSRPTIKQRNTTAPSVSVTVIPARSASAPARNAPSGCSPAMANM